MQDTLKYIRESLDGLYPLEEINSFIRIIMESVTGYSLPIMLSDKSKKLTPIQASAVKDITDRLKQHEPIQYILGETEFYGLKFIVDKNVLIPRPETEELVERIINENKHKKSVSILDIGTGSGAIAISLRKYLSDSIVEAWDISPEALEVASANTKHHNTHVLFKQINVFNRFPDDKKYDIIVSNPPYVLESEKQQMDKNVLEHEPSIALFVPDNEALIFYERIAEIATQLLEDNGRLYFEINAAKGYDMEKMLSEKGFQHIDIIKDISGKNRFVKTELK